MYNNNMRERFINNLQSIHTTPPNTNAIKRTKVIFSHLCSPPPAQQGLERAKKIHEHFNMPRTKIGQNVMPGPRKLNESLSKPFNTYKNKTNDIPRQKPVNPLIIVSDNTLDAINQLDQMVNSPYIEVNSLKDTKNVFMNHATVLINMLSQIKSPVPQKAVGFLNETINELHLTIENWNFNNHLENMAAIKDICTTTKNYINVLNRGIKEIIANPEKISTYEKMINAKISRRNIELPKQYIIKTHKSKI